MQVPIISLQIKILLPTLCSRQIDPDQLIVDKRYPICSKNEKLTSAV
jgi:hypothetical protein